MHMVYLRRVQVCLLGALLTCAIHGENPTGTRLLRQPSLSSSQVAFIFAGDVWTAPRSGGTASRLTRTSAAESTPRFSPDGKWIAFTRDGDVYAVSAAGGNERRLTWHPAGDGVAGWTPDGRKVLFHSARFRGALTHHPHLFLVPIEGGQAEPLPIPRATTGSFSTDGRRIAYGPNPEVVFWLPWKRYRGGSLGYIAIYDLESHRYEEVPRVDANDISPMWLGGAIYFASDRERTMNLYRYDVASKRTRRLTAYTEWDVKNPSLGPDAIVYENGGWLYALDLGTNSIRQIPVSVPEEAQASGEQRTKWLQALDDAWRAFSEHAFYVPPDWDRMRPRYRELMASAAHVSDAHYVLSEMLAEAGQSHVRLGRAEAGATGNTGLLGADFTLESGFYRIGKIYRGDENDGKGRGPLAANGLSVSEGDYLIAVDGKPIRAGTDVYSAFQGLAGKEVSLTLNRAPSENGAWDIVVKPIEDEASLRYVAWERDNRARVADATAGRVGYIHLASVDQVEKFQKEWSAQRNRVDAVILDIRNNSGGGQEDAIYSWLARRPTHLLYSRHGRYPGWDHHLDGPKVMLINDQSGSGADALALLYKHSKLGPLVGTRTVGALIGAGATYKITGGWNLTVPENGFYWPELRRWSPENYGVAPDFAVELQPYAMTDGRDPQLEKAIELALEALKTYRKIPEPPPYEPSR